MTLRSLRGMVATLGAFWVALENLDLRAGAPVRKLEVAGGKLHAGEVSASFVPAKPFTFLPVKLDRATTSRGRVASARAPVLHGRRPASRRGPMTHHS